MARIQSIVADLMLASKVEETLRSSGHEVVAGTDPRADVELIVADLDAVDPGPLATAGPPTLGFYQHTDVATRAAAEDAGIDLVVPRSRMARELPELAARLLNG